MKFRSVIGASVVAALAGAAWGQTDLVANGGLETGSFGPEWTQFGDLSFTNVVATAPHSGTFCGEFGPLALGGIQQTLIASAGQQVLVSFWLKVQGPTNTFTASLGGQNLTTLTNTTAHTAWTQFAFLATVPSANPVLEFGFINAPDYTYLDDVHVYSDGFGACCLGDATCIAQTAAGCTAAGGVYRGNGVACGSIICPTGACCLGNGSCVVTGPGGCLTRNGVYRGDSSPCGSANCTAVSFVPAALSWNFNGMVHGQTERGQANRDNLNGYRSISDRGLLLDGVAGSINAGPVVDPDFMTFTLVGQAAQLDCVHLGDRAFVDNGNWNWGTRPETGLQPTWLPISDQTTPQVSDLTSMNAVFGPNASVGILYQVSNGGGKFDVTLTFSDNSSATVSVEGPDWFQDRSPPPVAPAVTGVATQRKLGVYTGTGTVDFANPDQPLNVAEAVINVGSLQAAGMGNFAGKTLRLITFKNPFCFNTSYPNPANGAGFEIIAATLGGLQGGTPPCYVNCDSSTIPPVLNVNDFICFNNRFVIGDPYANCDSSTIPPVLNVNDYICFVGRYAAGCGR